MAIIHKKMFLFIIKEIQIKANINHATRLAKLKNNKISIENRHL